jgi:Tol biopolymer transport system component
MMKLSRLAASALIAASTIGAISHASQEEIGILVANPSPSPNAARIVFEARFDGVTNLWIVDAVGTGLRKLTSNGSTDEEPSWSPNGNQIAFSSTHAGVADIWVIAPDGTALAKLTTGALNNHQPTWSPDGTKIAFVSDRGGSNDIWIMNADGSAPRRLTTLPGQENHPSFSPAGDRVAFSYTLGSTAQIYTVPTAGGAPTRITPAGAFHDWNPQWGLSGILFSSDRNPSIGQATPWIVQPNGTGLREFSNVPALDPVMLPSGLVVFSDEFSTLSTESALSQITLLSPSNGAKQPVTSVAGRFIDGDVNIDGRIDCSDLNVVKASIGKRFGQAGFNAQADVNHDGIVDIRDISFVSQKLSRGTVCK